MITTDTETSTFDAEAAVRQEIGASALKLFKKAQRQRENAEVLYAAANKFFSEARKDRSFDDMLYKNEMRECLFYRGLEGYRRRLEDKGDEIAMESRDYVDFLTLKAFDAMLDLNHEPDALMCAYGDYCEDLAKAIKANLDAGSITGERAVHARKFIRHHLGQSAAST